MTGLPADQRLAPYSFEGVWTGESPGPKSVSELLPDIASATATDTQVGIPLPDDDLVRLQRASPPPVSVDALATKPWVRSLVSTWDIRSDAPILHLRELLMVFPSSLSPKVLPMLPGLESLAARRVAAPDLASIADLRDLDCVHLTSPDAIRHAVRLERLRARSEVFGQTVAPLLGLERLRWLGLNGWGNVRALGRIRGLERIETIGSSMTDFRGWKDLDDLRHLVFGGDIRSLDGIEAFQRLEYLSLGLGPRLGPSAIGTLTGLQALAIGADQPVDLGFVASLTHLQRFTFLGDAGGSTPIPSVRFLHGLAELEEIELRCVALEDPRLGGLAELPRLRRLIVTGEPGPDVAELDRLRPDIEIKYRFAPEPAGRMRVGPIRYDRPAPGIPTWSIFQDLHSILSTDTNDAAEQKIRTDLRRRGDGLLDRLRFDSEAGGVGIYATTEVDIRAAAEAIAELAARRAATREAS